MADYELIFKDYSPEVLAAMEDAVSRALERCGTQAEGYAKTYVPTSKSGGGYGGTLKNSISHKVDPAQQAVYVGTDMEYAAYVEFGTGAYAKNGGGRPGWWVYVKGSKGSGSKARSKTYTFEEAKQVMAILRSKGLDAHMTNGQKPKPYLKPAITEHTQTYRNIIEDEMKNG